MSREEGSGLEIYNLLMAGQTVKLTFSSMEEMKKMRNNIAAVKKRQDRVGVDIGLFNEEEISVFSCVITCKEPPNITAVLSFLEEDRRKRKYTYEIVDNKELLKK